MVLAESHSHTNVSTHAYSSFEEMVNYCIKNKIQLLSLTDHGPALPDSPHEWHFGNMRVLPRIIEGVYIVRGIEANVLDIDGTLDLRDEYLNKLDLVIASIHTPTYEARSFDEHTETYLNIAKNKVVDIIGHCGSDEFMFDYKKCIPVFRDNNIAVELNNHSFVARKGASVNCVEIAKLCKKYNAKIVLSSDAHVSYQICKTDNLDKILKEIDFPDELILNRNADNFLDWLENKKGRKLFDRIKR